MGSESGSGSGRIYLTREKLVELEKELHELKTTGRNEIAAKIAEARGYGDLSENAEYDVAKEMQQHLEMKIAKLEDILLRAQVIDVNVLDKDKVHILSRVKLQDQRSKEIIEYLLVAPEEADFEKNKISVTSPIGKGLLGKKTGESVEIKVPAGLLIYKILEINH